MKDSLRKYSRRAANIAMCMGLILAPAVTFGFAYLNQSFVASPGGVGVRWTNAKIEMTLRFPVIQVPLSNGSRSWGENVLSAMSEWGGVGASLRWSQRDSVVTECGGAEGTNVVEFRNDVCGKPFGDVVAITLLSYFQASDGSWEIVDADVLFNDRFRWNAYDGELQRRGGEILYDLRRVALHELGHVAGLLHPDELNQKVPAIMNSAEHGLFQLASDDKAGLSSLYGIVPGTGSGSSIPPVVSGGTDRSDPSPTRNDGSGGGADAWMAIFGAILLCVRQRARFRLRNPEVLLRSRQSRPGDANAVS